MITIIEDGTLYIITPVYGHGVFQPAPFSYIHVYTFIPLPQPRGQGSP